MHFKKHPLQFKSQTKMRSSAVRELMDAIRLQFPSLQASQSTDPDSSSLFSLPVIASSWSQWKTRAASSSEPLEFLIYAAAWQQQPGTAAAPSSSSSSTALLPLFYQLAKGDAELIPTVYTLWNMALMAWNESVGSCLVGEMCVALTIHAPVFRKLQNGADLMAPGLAVDSVRDLPDFQVGQLVAIQVAGVPVPLGIGRALMNSEDLKKSGQLKGRLVEVLHLYLDTLWACGDQSHPPMELHIQMEKNMESMETMNQEDEKHDVPEGSLGKELSSMSIDNPGPQESEPPMPTAQEMDLLLQQSLLSAIHHRVIHDESVVIADLLPISASTFYSQYMSPCRPWNAPALDLKRSSYKKMQKFLKAMEKKGYLKMKELRTGDIVITSLDVKHPEIVQFQKFRLAGATKANVPASDSTSRPTQSQQPSTTKRPELKHTELWQPRSNMDFLFKTKDALSALYTKHEVKQRVEEYIRAESLLDPSRPRMVQVNPHLTKFTEANGDQDYIPRDQLALRILSKMQPFYRLDLQLDHLEPIVKRGTLDRINVVLEPRQGRKVVTRITNLELYLIDISQMTQELPKLCASSVSVHDVGSIKEVVIQGKASQEVLKYLADSFGVPEKFVEIVDKTSKKKK